MSNCTRCFSGLPALAVFCPTCQQPQAPAFDSLLKQTVGGRYLVQQRLTNGGLSAVFLATDLSNEQLVVLKFSDPQHLVRRETTYTLEAETARAYWAEMLERMRYEAKMLLSLRHPHIVQLCDIGKLNDDLRYLVLEYVPGVTLHDALLSQPRPSLSEALRITLILADALEHVHARGIIHRDVNPRNVMLGENAQMKLIDFGIAKFPQPPGAPPFTQHSLLRGTVAYAAPEQCQNLPLDARSDVYSLGVMLYELTTGRRPFAGRTPTEIALQQIQAAPVAPRQLNAELSPALEAVILRTLAKDPAQRPASAAAFAAELRSAARRIVIALPEPVPVATAPVPAAPPFHFSTFERAAAPHRVLPRVLAATAGLAICLAAGVGSLDYQRVERLLARDTFQPLPTDTSIATGEFGEVMPTVETSAVVNAPDAFEMTQRPAEHWTAALAANMTLPLTRKPAAPSVKTASRPLAPAVAPAVAQAVQLAPTIPPYAMPPSAMLAPLLQSDPAQSVAPRVVLAPPLPPAEALTTDNEHSPQATPSANSRRTHTPDYADWQPHLIAWNGEVWGERLLRIELPGKPGRVEIPRAYRHRVGIVEPPQPGNDWGCVRLRVVGRGMVNVLIRWWPN